MNERRQRNGSKSVLRLKHIGHYQVARAHEKSIDIMKDVEGDNLRWPHSAESRRLTLSVQWDNAKKDEMRESRLEGKHQDERKRGRRRVTCLSLVRKPAGRVTTKTGILTINNSCTSRGRWRRGQTFDVRFLRYIF